MAIDAALHHPLAAVGHRVVQGGMHSHTSRAATPELIAQLDSLSPLAPDHQPYNLAPIRALNATRPDLPQTVSFDTAFHRTQPRIAQLYALPRALTDSGIMRYGYHGLSYAHIARRLPEHFPAHRMARTLALHLGSGSSLCAILDGQSIATSMGFSGDLRQLEASCTAEADEAIALYIYRIVRECGSHISALGGIDALVFTGGVGENSSRVRSGIAAGLAWAGVSIEDKANRQGARVLSPDGAPASVFVLPADEESEIARDCLALL